MTDLERAREWLEWVYCSGRGAPADHANLLIDLINEDSWNDAMMAKSQGFDKPRDDDPLDYLFATVERELALLNDIREALTNAGAIDDTSDIPATLRLLLGP